MIRIGQTLISKENIVAVYPSAATPGKVWISLKNGRTVWARATMPEAVEAVTDSPTLAAEFEVLEEAGEDDDTPPEDTNEYYEWL